MSDPTRAQIVARDVHLSNCSYGEGFGIPVMEAGGESLEGTLVPAPQPAGICYEDETQPDAVTRVLVVVERADGSVKEYEAREPQDWSMNDPESISAQVIRTTGLSFGTTRLQAGMPSLRLSFSAHPRYNLHIRNVRWPGGEPGPSQSSIPSASTSSPAVTGNGS
jgi:hypothetical protein